MIFNRKALKDLEEWAKDSHRKPLIIRGARQVGKSTLVRMLGENFDHFLELNVEKPEIKVLFDQYTDVTTFLQALYLKYNINEIKGNFLLFIDEIQEAPSAIRLLRYFYEEAPEVHVIAAGSLLDFSLGEVKSFPVGRVSYYYLYPLNFEEFLTWTNNYSALSALQQIPVPIYAHTILLNLFHQYAMIGGMPEVVALFAQNQNVARLNTTYEELWQAYLDDIEKYSNNSKQRQILRHVIRTIPLAQDRIKFANFGQSNYGSRDVGQALRSLELARIIQLIYPTTQLKPPIISDLKKRPRLQMLDTGLLNYSLNVQHEFLAIDDLHQIYKGRIIQHLLTQELIATYSKQNYIPHFWVREDANANAEVDLVYEYRGSLLPIEIKAGPQGRLRSLHQFIERSDQPYAIRFLRNEYTIEKHTTPGGTPYTLMNLPYYLMTQLESYAAILLDIS